MTSLQRSAETTVVSGVMLAMLLGVSAWSWSGWQPMQWFGNWNWSWPSWSYQQRWYPPWQRGTPPPAPTPTPTPNPNPQPPVYCTQEVMQCADGSYVGRIPPSCAFKACPVAPATGTISGRVTIAPLCPVEPCWYQSYNPYIGRTVIMTPQSATGTVVYASLSYDGSFYRTVPAGTYSITLSPCSEMGCRTALPKTAIVPPNGAVQVTIDIDTGLRQ